MSSRALRATSAALVLAVLAAVGMLAGPGTAGGESEAPEARERFQVLVYSRTAGFRHASIEVGVATIHSLGQAHGFGVAATEDPRQFTYRRLRPFEAIVFLNTTGTVLPPPNKRAFARYIRSGGGFVGIHSAADTEHSWPFYGRLVGAWFKSHPIQQFAYFDNEARRHPSTSHLAGRFMTFDEFYSFKSNPRARVNVLLAIDESTYSPDPNTSHLPGGNPSSGVMGDHPMSWCHDNLGGRAFYTALGHESYLYLLDWYRRHLLGGILVATRQLRANCSSD